MIYSDNIVNFKQFNNLIINYYQKYNYHVRIIINAKSKFLQNYYIYFEFFFFFENRNILML